MDLKRIEALLALLADHDVTEFSFKDEDVSLRLRLGPPPATIAAPMAAPQLLAATPAPAPVREAAPAADAAPPADASLATIESPMVGTFYRAASPDSPNFVEVGARVGRGQTLCIVEAMKLMNEIESEVAGTVVEILVGNADPVQFGQALFKIRPD